MKNKLMNKLKIQKEKSGTWGTLERYKLKIIRKYSGNKILDIGCSSGNYVKYLIDHQYDAYGCDILNDRQWNKIGKEKFSIADIYKLPYKNNSFDTILLLEVLEHLNNPRKALSEIKRVTKKSLILSVPNCESSPIFPISGLSFFHWIDRTHINFFTVISLRKLLEENGFVVKKIEKINPVMPESLILFVLGVPNKICELVGKILQRFPFNKKLYTDILVIAEKK